MVRFVKRLEDASLGFALNLNGTWRVTRDHLSWVPRDQPDRLPQALTDDQKAALTEDREKKISIALGKGRNLAVHIDIVRKE